MSLVRRRRFREYFERSNDDNDFIWQFSEEPLFNVFFYGKRRYFHPFTVAVLFLLQAIVLCFTAGRPGFVLGISALIFLSFLFLQAKSAAEGLTITHSGPNKASENEEIQFKFKINNSSAFAIGDLTIFHRIPVTRNSLKNQTLTESIGPLSSVENSFKVKCDTGMGTFKVGPIHVLVSDCFGIFQFVVSDLTTIEVEVFPKFIPIDTFFIPSSIRSHSVGLNESLMSGQAAQFLCVREYSHGDPLKKIHWKLSAKLQHLIVKEFESTVRTDLTLGLDLSWQNHIGLSGQSSWDYLKSAAISLVHQSLPLVNRFQMLSQEVSIPFGKGAEHQNSCIKIIKRLLPIARDSEFPGLDVQFSSIPAGSTLILILPVYQNDLWNLEKQFSQLQDRGIKVVSILVDSRTFTESIPGELSEMVSIKIKNQIAKKLSGNYQTECSI